MRRIFTLLFASVLMVSCSTAPAPAGPKTAALLERVPEVQAIVDRLDFILNAQRTGVASELVATKHAAEAISDPTVKRAVTASVENAQAELGADPDPELTAAAVARVDLNLAGEIDKAASKYKDAAEEAAKVISGAAEAREKRDRGLADAVTLATGAKAENEALTAKFERDKQAAVDKARGEFMRYLNFGLLGIAGVLYLVAAATAYLSSGKEWLRAGIAALLGSVAICIAYTVNQPYFKYVAGGVTLLIAAALGLFIWSERRSAVKSIEAERVRGAFKKVVESVDQIRSEVGDAAKPLVEKLRANMDADHKLVVQEIRHDTLTGN